MVTMTVVYPYSAERAFDEGYYLATHIPLARKIWREALTDVTVHYALAGLAEAPPYAAIVHLEFASMAAFQGAMAHPRAGELQADVANFSGIAPHVQLSRRAA